MYGCFDIFLAPCKNWRKDGIAIFYFSYSLSMVRVTIAVVRELLLGMTVLEAEEILSQ